ncbi:unnamed protein product [Polarella glacialis]|uniref:Helicase C-terminal domain-containing protein n=1 Tax=Polarella glacialis TaxID=89957 RepID=A0A813GCM4_POLGL|nr:unnamed protein product [Polarella glacialis]
MADLLAELGESGRACVIVPKLHLMEQVARLLESMALPGISRVGTGHSPDMDARIFVCVRNSAWRLAELSFDLLLLDEAHHYEPLRADAEDQESDIIGDEPDESEEDGTKWTSQTTLGMRASTVLSLHARKRLFFSATLRWSQPNFDFGLRVAVRARVISDYSILVPFMTAGDPKPSLVKLIQDLPTARRILAFCNTVKEAKQFAQLLNAAGILAGHYNGCTAGPQRTKILEDFEKGPGRGGLRVLVTVDVLSEGVDLPMADTCLFVEPKRGVKLRQCVGRVLRQHPQKVDALVVAPPIVQQAPGGDLQADSELIRLLSELLGADDELRKSLVQNSFGRVSIVDQRSNRSENPTFAQEQAATLLSTSVYPRALSSHFFSAGARWELGLAQLIQYKAEHKHCKVMMNHKASSGFALGAWVCAQRFAYRITKLTFQQIEQLDSLGFVWDAHRSAWAKGFEHLKAYEQENDHTAVPNSYNSDDGFKLGSWVSDQRKTRKGQGGGKLEPDQIEQLDSLGFAWDAQRSTWDKGFEHLQAYRKENDHTSVPRPYNSDDGFKLGCWAHRQRQARKGKGRRNLEPDQIEQLDSLGFVWSPLAHKSLSK